MKIVLKNLKAYDAAGKGDHSLYSCDHCCVCGKQVVATVEWLLCVREITGACEYAIKHPDDATSDERRNGMWVAPIGRDCLKKFPQLKMLVLSRVKK